METNSTVYIVTKNYDYDSGILKVFNSLDKAQKYCEDELQKYIGDFDLSASFYSTEHNCENCKDKTVNCKKYADWCEHHHDYTYYSIRTIAVE